MIVRVSYFCPRLTRKGVAEGVEGHANEEHYGRLGTGASGIVLVQRRVARLSSQIGFEIGHRLRRFCSATTALGGL